MNKLNAGNAVLNKKYFFFLVGFIILLAATVLRFYNIGQQSAWYDEIGSLTFYSAHNSLIAALINSHKDLFPPVFNLLLWIDFNIFGTSIETGRWLSAYFGLSSVAIFALLAATYSNKFIGLIIMLITATHPYFIYYSREMRPYSALLFFGLLSYYLLITCNQKKSAFSVIFWALSLALAFNTHIIAVVIVIHQLLRIFLDPEFSFIRRQRKAHLLLAVFSLYPLYLIYLSSQQAFSQNPWSWIGSISLLDRLKAASSVWMAYSGLAYVLILTVFVVYVICITKNKYAETLRKQNWLFLDSISLLMFGLLLDILCYKHFSDKYYMLVFALFLVGLLGLINNEITSAKSRNILLGLLTLFFMANAAYRFNWHPINEDYKSLLLKASSTSNKSLVFITPHQEGLKLYAAEVAPQLHIVDMNSELPVNSLVITDKVEFLKETKPELYLQMHLADPDHFRLWSNF